MRKSNILKKWRQICVHQDLKNNQGSQKFMICDKLETATKLHEFVSAPAAVLADFFNSGSSLAQV